MRYLPTAMGGDLLAPLIAARNWGAAWCADNREVRQGLEHGICGQPLQDAISLFRLPQTDQSAGG